MRANQEAEEHGGSAGDAETPKTKDRPFALNGGAIRSGAHETEQGDHAGGKRSDDDGDDGGRGKPDEYTDKEAQTNSGK